VHTRAEAPPPYPRVPHLLPWSAATRDDDVLSDEARRALLAQPVRVEEKLDGANVCLWSPDGRTIEVAGRGGAGAMDRARQLGRLRAWVAERLPALLPGMDRGAVYGEWLLLSHGISYRRLPSLLVGLDVLAADGWLRLSDRDSHLWSMGLPAPPVLFEGKIRDQHQLRSLLDQPSRLGAPVLEGVILRSAEASADRFVAKVVRREHRAPSDAEWRRGRPLNSLH
jgi:hypothetical protein